MPAHQLIAKAASTRLLFLSLPSTLSSPSPEEQVVSELKDAGAGQEGLELGPSPQTFRLDIDFPLIDQIFECGDLIR